MADVDQSLVELFLRIGLTDQRAVNTAKSEAIAPRLKAIAEAAGVAESGCDHAMGVLLYDLASKHAKVVTDADEHFTARAYLVGCIINGQLESGAQLTAAVKWIKGNGGAPPVEADDVSAFEAASGVGISYTNEEIAAAVAALIEEERETLVEQRYLYPTGRMLGTLNKQRLLWADGTVVKAELDAQILALLGPETDADREAKKAAKKGKKKGKGGGKNNKATRKDNVSEAEAAAIEAEAEALRAEWGATPKIIKYTDTPRTQIKDILQSKSAWLEQDICVAGWIKQLRWQSETLGFCEVNDGSVVVNIQCVVNGSKVDADVFAAFKERAAVGASVIIRGTLVRSPGSEQFSEIQAASAEVPGMCDRETFPLAGENMSVEFLRGQAHLRSRTKVVGAVARVRSALAHAVHTFFTQNDFFYLHTPLVTTSDCEGAGEAFQVTTMDLKNIPLTEDGEVDFGEDFFKRQAMLTVSGQLNAEAYACGISKVFTFGPTFRAEDSNTARHLAEFWMIEPEVAFCDIIGNMDLAEDFLKFTLSYVMEHNRAELEFFATLEGNEDLLARLENVVSTPFARITYTEMIEILESAPEEVKEGFEYPFYWGVDLASEHERYVAEQHFKGPVIVRDYPKEIKAFYMRENDHDPRTVAAMDVLVPGVGEIIGGSQREERYEVLERRLEELEMEPEPYWWYMDLRKYGSVKHSGFGLGFERLVMYATGVKNIRESIPFPRYPGHAEF